MSMKDGNSNLEASLDALANGALLAEEGYRLLAEARASADHAARLKSDFLARISHELRTPMTGVLGMAALLERSDLDARQRHYLMVLKRSGQHMIDLIDALMTLSAHENDRLDVEPKAADLTALCRQAAEMVRPKLVEKGLTLGLKGCITPGPKVMVDATRLLQILTNLLDNAVKFTAAGEVVLSLALEPVEGAVEARIEVSDTGVGIAEPELDRIFQKFVQCGDDPRQRRDGMGLGLSIARSLAEMMGGALSARSRPGEGSVFSLDLSLPLAPTPIGLACLGEVQQQPDKQHLRHRDDW